MLTVVKTNDNNAYNISDAEYMCLLDNRLIIGKKEETIINYKLPLSEEHSKRFFDVFLGNLSINNYINIEKILEYNFKDVILETREQQEDGEC